MRLFNYDNISWNLPLMFGHDEMIFAISDVIKDFPNLPRPKLHAYGSVTSPWSGGRATCVKFFEFNYLENHLNKIISSGFIPTFTFTKSYVKPEDLDDKISNWILAYGIEHNCEFLVTSDNLYNYIKDKYPEAKISASILQSKMKFHNKNVEYNEKSELEFYNEQCNHYNRVVIRPEFAIYSLEKNINDINNIAKFEVLVNETCFPNCNNAVKCYSSHDKIITLESFKEDSFCTQDNFVNKNGIKKAFNNLLMMDKEFIDNLVNNIGIKHLKIQGRHYFAPYLFNLILYYLFNEDGKFQSIYPYIIDLCKKYKFNMEKYPYEQQLILKKLIVKNSIYRF